MSLGTGGLSRRELLRQLHEGIRATGEPDWSLVLPGFEIHDPELLDSRQHHGRRGRREWSANWERVFPDYSMEAVGQIEIDPDRILTVHRLRARGGASDIELIRTDAQLWTFKGRPARQNGLPAELRSRDQTLRHQVIRANT